MAEFWFISVSIWDVIAFLLLAILIVSLFDSWFRIQYTKMEAAARAAQKEELDKFEAEMSDNEQSELSQVMSERGTKGGRVKQEKALERKFYEGMLQSPEAELALAGLERFNPELAEYVNQNPHLIGSVMKLLEKHSGSNGFTMPVALKQGNGGKSSGWNI